MGSSHSCLSTPFLHRYHRSTDRSVDQPVDVRNAMNINRASEDELLLLPGITSSIAQNLVEYRQRVGGFKQTDEMLRVNGMNGKIFQRIRSDISLGVPPVSAEDQHSNLINLNLASHDELCSLPGLTPILVQRILQRRERKGNFQFIEDLLQIKGIDYFVLARIRSRLTVEQQRSQSSLNYSSTNNLGPAISSDTLSLASLLVETLPPEVQTLLRSSLPRRPAVKDPLAPSGFRFASWNLQQLTVEKVRNPGVREVICRTILDHKYGMDWRRWRAESIDLLVWPWSVFKTSPAKKRWISSPKNWTIRRFPRWKRHQLVPVVDSGSRWSVIWLIESKKYDELTLWIVLDISPVWIGIWVSRISLQRIQWYRVATRFVVTARKMPYSITVHGRLSSCREVRIRLCQPAFKGSPPRWTDRHERRSSIVRRLSSNDPRHHQ